MVWMSWVRSIWGRRKTFLFAAFLLGGVSTLASRKNIINDYKLRQHKNYEDGKRELTADEKAMLAEGWTGAAYISKANRLDAEITALKAKYERNVLAIADIIEYVDNATPIKVEDMLADDLIREFADRKRNNKWVKLTSCLVWRWNPAH